jgi:hypothetical protein
MENHVHYSDQNDTMEANDWRPYVIIGLLAAVIALGLLSI